MTSTYAQLWRKTSASERPSQIAASLKHIYDIPDNHERKASMSFVERLRCTTKAALQQEQICYKLPFRYRTKHEAW
jgi:hypothetical protein